MSLIKISCVDIDHLEILGEPYDALVDTDNIFMVTEGEKYNTIILIDPSTDEKLTAPTLTSVQDIWEMSSTVGHLR